MGVGLRVRHAARALHAGFTALPDAARYLPVTTSLKDGTQSMFGFLTVKRNCPN